MFSIREFYGVSTRMVFNDGQNICYILTSGSTYVQYTLSKKQMMTSHGTIMNRYEIREQYHVCTRCILQINKYYNHNSLNL